MKFGPVKIDEAVGTLLAHSLTVGKKIISKGHELTAADIVDLRLAGHETLTVARLDENDMGEDQAAEALARMIAGGNLEIRAGTRGRANIHATTDGLLTIDVETLTALNSLSEKISVATLNDFARGRSGGLVASVKIIPFALPKKLIAEAQAISKGKSLLTLNPFKPLRASLILTSHDNKGSKVAVKSEAVTRRRLEAIGSSLVDVHTTRHEIASLATALSREVEGASDIILILGCTATSDRDDIIPSAIMAAGGQVHRVGMRVDPGNLLVLGELMTKTVIGLPGCATSPAHNGFDWVLERVAAGLIPDNAAFAAMGAGGLLKESPGRPTPREARLSDKTSRNSKPEIHVLMLAAGLSSRMGKKNKLLQAVHGRPMIAQVVAGITDPSIAQIHVVTGHDAEKIAEALQDWTIRIIHNPDYESGMASSLAAGIGSLPRNADGVLIMLGDMPDVSSSTIACLLSEARANLKSIILPTWRGKHGHPVYFGRNFFKDLIRLEGDRGAKALLEENRTQVITIEVDDPGIHLDLDSTEALAAHRQKNSY